MHRRDFFKVVATSGAAAAVAGCQPTAEKILPLVVPNEQLVPGVAAWFATVCRECPAGCGVIAKNREGRVVKVEGNPDHPVNQGALCIRGQAALQQAYHPDRFDGPQRRDGTTLARITWDDAVKTLGERITALRAAGKGKAIALVTQLESGSPAVLMDGWTQALGARPRVTFEPFGYEALRTANQRVFGRDAIPYYAFEDAEAVLSFGADIVETWLSNVGYARAFARMHTFRDGRAGTFVHVEPRQSVTAANADEWVRNAPGTEGRLALAVLKVLVEEGLADRRFGQAVEGVDLAKVSEESGVPVETIRHVAEVFGHARPGLAVGGGVAVTGTNATETLVAINMLNAAVGALGRTVRFGPDAAYAKVTPFAQVAQLVEAMGRGEIELLLLGPRVNPAFALPAGLKFAEAAAKVPMVVSFANQPDETTALAHLILPDTHWLESWSDYAPRDGVLGLLQPTMAPVRDALPIGDVLLRVARAVLNTEEGKGPLPWASSQDFIRARWASLVGPARPAGSRGAPSPPSPPGADEEGWVEALQRGGLFSGVATAPVSGQPAKVEVPLPKLDGDAAGLALIAYPSLRMYDGRTAGSSWLQEAPDTMTQVSWDAWVEVPSETAGKLGVVNGDVVRVTSPHGAVELAAYVSPTLHPGAVAIPIGHRYAPFHRAYVIGPPTSQSPLMLLGPVADAGSGGAAYLTTRVTLTRTGSRRPLAILQATHDQQDRELAQHEDLRSARERALRGKGPEREAPSMYPPQLYPGYRWGLTIDVDACVGCQACVVACQAENNVAVVGKAQAAYGRQLHWLRLERWAEGRPEHPQNLFLPMLCQHCEVAPCEPVCPVFAAYRTEEGLNAQVYNRCVGTRYCGNNCPYHVRRFNWYNWVYPEPLQVQLNPDVTVRQLGVMEKCTMCVQRIIAGKDHARDEQRSVRDGDIVTACQQTCPTQAITFGNLKDESSEATKLTHSARAYHVLAELGTRPSVTYLRKIVRDDAG